MIVPAEALGTAAQIAVTLAGFAGVVVVFGRRSLDEWSGVDRFRLQLLLTSSAHALMLSIGSMLLLSTGLSEAAVWSWSSGVAVVSFVSIAAAGARTFRSFREDDLRAGAVSKISFYIVSLAAVASALLQIYNVLAARTFWPFFTLIVVAILASTLQFVRMVLARPASN